MTTKHTPGGLSRNIPPINRYPVLFAGRNTHVAQVVFHGTPEAEAEANADRLVACWNACEGMTDPAAEIAALRAALAGLLDAVCTNNEGGTPRTADQIFSIAGYQARAALGA